MCFRNVIGQGGKGCMPDEHYGIMLLFHKLVTGFGPDGFLNKKPFPCSISVPCRAFFIVELLSSLENYTFPK